MAEWRVIYADCRDVLPTIPDGSVDVIISDPPYPMINRKYGMLTEAEWHDLMRVVVAESRRVLKPKGSAVFILQPNSERVGRMRLWLFEFIVWAGREWNLVQDVWWWNTAALPRCGQVRERVLPRPSLKACVWLGPEDCYRDIDRVLKDVSETVRSADLNTITDSYPPSGWRGEVRPRFNRSQRMYRKALERGGSTPFNVLPIANTDSQSSAGAGGHGAGTPFGLADWWTRYICPPGGTVLDPFAGSGTMGLAAIRRNCHFLGIEKEMEYVDISRRRLSGPPLPLFDPAPAESNTPLFDSTEI